MGYNKRDMISANKIALKKKEDEKKEERERILLATPRPVRIKTIEEKKKCKFSFLLLFRLNPHIQGVDSTPLFHPIHFFSN